MKIIIAVLLGVALASLTTEESVVKLLADLKHNADLDLQALDQVWEKRIKGKQDLADLLNNQILAQRAECNNKQDDVKQKEEDIKTTESYINWMLFRQGVNIKRVQTLEANRCAQTNNYVRDIKNYKIALALIKFLRTELAKLQNGASLAEIQSYHNKLIKFVKIYQSGKLLNMVQTLEKNPNGELNLMEIDEALDLEERTLSGKIEAAATENETESHPANGQSTDVSDGDNAVVLIPGCDNQVGTVVVVQNSDGTSDDDDLKIKFQNGGSSGGSRGSRGGSTHPGKPKQPKDSVDDIEDFIEALESQDSESSSSSSSSSSSESDSEGDSEGESSVEGEYTVGSAVYFDPDSEEYPEDDEAPEEIEFEHEHGRGLIIPDDDDDFADATWQGPHDHDVPDGHARGLIVPSGEELNGDDAVDGEDDDFPDTPEGFNKLLDALEKHIIKSLGISQEDEIRSSLGFIDYKLHVELENDIFDKTIGHEREYQVKQQNLLKGRVQASVLCGARLKQLDVAYKISLNDIDAAKKFYQEQRALKVDELNTFDDVYRIYQQQVK